MDTAVNIWNLLWDWQIPIAVMLILAIWLVVRGSDVMRWAIRLFRRLNGKEPAGKK